MKKAYKYRIKNVINIERNSIGENQKQASNYLDILIDDELIDAISLGSEDKTYLKERLVKSIFNFGIYEGLVNMKILMLGPGYSGKNIINIDEYDYIVLNKPLLDKVFEIPSNKIIIILNNQWSIGKFKEKTKEWIENNDYAMIFTQNNLSIKKNNIYIRNSDTQYLNASPMGLQRAISILISELNPKEIEVVGYDFQLSSKPYHNWYPSGISSFFESFYKAWAYTNEKHDFLFNFMYVKKLKQKYGARIFGSIDPYLEMPIGGVITLFEKRMKALRN